MNFHICSLLGDPDWWNPFGFPAAAILTDYFAPIAGRANTGPILASLMPQAEDVKDEDLLVYVLPSGGLFNSIVAKMARSLWSPSLALTSEGGLTLDVAPPGKVSVVSEVYWDRIRGDRQAVKQLANTIFHEFMHNKLDVVEHNSPGEQYVHTNGGKGLADKDFSASAQLSKGNIEVMARAIRKKHPQHTGHLRASDIPPGRPIP